MMTKSVHDLVGLPDRPACEAALAAYSERFRTLMKAAGEDAGIKNSTRAQAEVSAAMAFAVAAAAVSSLQARVNALEAQAAEMAERGLRFRGVWQKADSYHRGDAITHASSVWICLRRETQQKPGDGDDWQLAVKGHRG